MFFLIQFNLYTSAQVNFICFEYILEILSFIQLLKNIVENRIPKLFSSELYVVFHGESLLLETVEILQRLRTLVAFEGESDLISNAHMLSPNHHNPIPETQ